MFALKEASRQNLFELKLALPAKISPYSTSKDFSSWLEERK